MEHVDLPVQLAHLSGKLIDIDSHEMMPAQVWVQECGDIAAPLAEAWLSMGMSSNTDINHPNVPGYVRDEAAIDPATIWQAKGSGAPGATDVARREAVMDAMGIERQLMFPTGVGMYGVFMATLDDNYGYLKGLDVPDRREYGIALIDAYNRWGMRVANVSDRVRPALPLLADSVDGLLVKTREMIAGGIKAVWLPADRLPGGTSPAHRDLDEFWELLASNNVAACLHVGAESHIYGTDGWDKAEAFEGFRLFAEFKIDPWSRANGHITAQNFLATTILGGVFERFPTLRFGIIELGAYWIGQICEIMDLWFNNTGGLKGSGHCYRLPRKPSDYVKRNVRVSPYDFEEIDLYIRRYGLEDVLCFASDYPHVEGGRDPAAKFYDRLAPLGDEVVEKFFALNGRLLVQGD